MSGPTLITTAFVLIMLFSIAPFILVYLGWRWRRKLSDERSGQINTALSQISGLAAASSLLLSFLAVFLALVFQFRNERATRVANQDAAKDAKEQRELLGKAVVSLNETAKLLEQQAKSNQAAASYLERQYSMQAEQRKEELERRQMVPDIRPGLELVVADGSPRELTTLSKVHWSNYETPFEIRLPAGTNRFEMDVRVTNVGRASLREGYVSLRAGFQKDVLLGFANHPPGNVDQIFAPLRNLRPLKQALSFLVERVYVVVPRLATGQEMKLNLFFHFEGDEAERRDANLWFKVRFD